MKNYPLLSQQINKASLKNCVQVTIHDGDTVASFSRCVCGAGWPSTLPLHAVTMHYSSGWEVSPANAFSCAPRAQHTKLISPEKGNFSELIFAKTLRIWT
jgi:hypothetical protein